MTALGYVGAAYACIWALLFVYVWRLTVSTKNIEKKLEELERKLS
jgi:CcmD family protein